MVTPKLMGTRQALIDSAGPLFAEKGYDSVTTRMIAEKAEVQLSAIHYHFGSKKKLYLNVFKLAQKYERATNFSKVIDENPALADTPEGQAEIIRNTIFRRFYDHFREDRPVWERQLVIREIISPSSIREHIVLEIFKPDNDAAVDFYKVVKKDAQKKEAEAWADLFHGKLFFYLLLKDPLEIARGKGEVDSEFFLISAKMLASAMILTLGLPLPADLQSS